MRTSRVRKGSLWLMILAITVSMFASAAAPAVPAAAMPKGEKLVFFVADGMLQNSVAGLIGQGLLPEFAVLYNKGAIAADSGMLTQAPPNTGAGWYSLATGAWSGVHGSTNNTFHKNGAAFNTRTAAFDPGVLQAESIAQSAERGGKKVAQIEWAGGRGALINGPTVDYRSFLSGRGVVTNYISPADMPNFVAAFGLQFDHPAGFAGQAPYAGAAPVAAAGWSNVPASFSPAMEVRMRVLDFGTDKYGLNAYIFDSTNDSVVNYDRVLLAAGKDGAAAAATLGVGQWADVKVLVADGNLAGKTAGFSVKLETLSGDLSMFRLFHTSVTRAIASWPGWSEPGFSGDFEEYVAQMFPVSTAADYAIIEAGIVSEETYVEQGLAWEKLYAPLTDYILKKYQPDLVLAGYPAIDEFQHQFLGLVTPLLPNGQPNPAYDDVQVNGTPDGRVAQRQNFLTRAYQGADATLARVRRLTGKDVTTFVASDHGFGAQFLAIDASRVLVDLGLLSKPQTSNCRPATGEVIGKAKACWAGGTVQIYLNLAGRDPTGGGLTQVPAASEAATVALIKAAFANLSDTNDWTGDGQPEGWMVIDRVYTKAEARYIPNGPNSTADMSHPTRTGDVVAFAYPPYQFDAATPGTLVALSAFFGQHGYVPDVQVLDANVNMRATFIAGGKSIAKGVFSGVRTIDLAPTAAFLLGVPMPQHAQGRVLLEIVKGSSRDTALTVLGLNDYHGQLEPTTTSIDGINTRVGGAAYLGTMFDEDMALLPGQALLLAAGDNVGASPPSSSLLQDAPAIDVENAWGLDATAFGNHEFDYGIDRLINHIERANFPFLAVNIVNQSDGKPPAWVETSAVFNLNGVQVGVIGVGLETTPELVSKGATTGLLFQPAIETIKKESERLRKLGVKVQIVAIHEGVTLGDNSVDGKPAIAWDGPIVTIANGLQKTTIDMILAGHTHKIANTMIGRILVSEGLNAGATYSVAQLVVRGGDVYWAGAANRLAKVIGVAPRPDVQAIVDDANAQTAVLRNKVVGTQQFDIKRAPSRLLESAMGNMVTDAMLSFYPGVDAAITNSGGLRADLNCSPPTASEAVCEITWGETFAVLPFGNRTTILTLTGAQLEQAMLNGFSPACNAAIATGRFPQVSGLKLEYTCNGLTPVVLGMWKAPNGVTGTLTPIGPADTIRIVTNDFMYGGSDGYTAFTQGTNVLQPGDDLMELTASYITSHSPVGPVVEGRIVRR